MRELEATGSPEPLACVCIRRWVWYLSHIAGENAPYFARTGDFDPTTEVCVGHSFLRSW